MKHARPPTILDVARAAGVSVGSVSNVMNGRRTVSGPVRAKVLEAAESLGYQANTVARTLRSRSSKVIGLCIPHTRSAYLNELFDSLDGIATAHGYELIETLTRQDPEMELKRVMSLASRHTDGLILLPSTRPQAALNAIHRARIPTVIVDRHCDDDRFSYVIPDNFDAMRQIVRSLAGYGHRRLLFAVRSLEVAPTRDRLAALEFEARGSDGALRYEVMEESGDAERFQHRLGQVLKGPDRPTAIILGNSIVALETITALRAMDLWSPERIALATFDNPDWAAVLTPPLTTVRMPTHAMAEAVWRLLEAQLTGELKKPESVAIKCELALRPSSMASFG